MTTSAGDALQEHVRAAMIHASVWHPKTYNEASARVTTLCLLALEPDVPQAVVIAAAAKLLEAMPDCRETCPERSDKGPGWKL